MAGEYFDSDVVGQSLFTLNRCGLLRGFAYHLHGLTYVLWCLDANPSHFFRGFVCNHLDTQDNSSPAAFTDMDGTADAPISV